ncbi:TonB-dependent receptor [Rhodocytophaga aerolata]|uniref:TonB-dependent receptor n=1 Tax=Rhodocytophaga aerolata TaxID=455078 RepID=A0ABT8QY34_9BACT|nr:TonB-dependent receptor [Rhodocytophaga aerolata]MDO1444756.1 TonB-dependent receptor [Rhodocytophaga aerolata]
MNKLVFFLILSLLCHVAMAQSGTQTIKGVLTDAQSKYPLIGANIVVIGTQPLIGSSTDVNGHFKLSNVPLGRQAIKVSYLGYQDRVLSNILVTSGKEVVISVELEEQVVTTAEVTVTAKRYKTETNNEFATLSARSFDIEETSRYAGSRNDPARMAANFAGVSGANDARNDIVIRGNSPSGLLWRLDGINIPNPSHYGALGATGGPVSMLNNNVLDRSDFMTAAFPAQYGNAIAGVFDLQLRNGNKDKREYLGQIGFNGFEVGIEGPFSKNSRASYLVNYRYSTLGVFQALGIDFGTGAATPQYQDLSFKIDIPTSKAGRFTVFGLGGTSRIKFLGDDIDTTSSTNLFGEESQDSYSDFRNGIIGASYTYYHNSSTYSKIAVAASTNWQSYKEDSLSLEDRSPFRRVEAAYTQNKYSINYLINKKFNARNSATLGLISDLYDFVLTERSLVTPTEFRDVRNSQGNSLLTQIYGQGQHRFTDLLTLNGGVNVQHFSLSNSLAVEPRLGLKYQFAPKQSLNFGYGYHSQMQPLLTYFNQTRLADGRVLLTNKNMNFTRSQHLVLGYDRMLSDNLRLKVETYYQYITKAPVEQRISSFSMLNAGADFSMPEEDSLVNRGTGRNYGIELTLEKFYSSGYYFLFTSSLFDSKYKGSDQVLRNTTFNGQYVVNLLAGKEFKVGNKNNVFNIDWKLTTAGGRHVTPIDLEKSRLAGEAVYRQDVAFSTQLSNYFRTDVKFSFRMNRQKTTHEFSLDLQNLTNNKNVFTQQYNARTNRIATEYQIGFFPIPQYRLLF